MYRREFRHFIEEANLVIDRCHARGVRTFDRSMSELADWRDYIEYARRQVEDDGVIYLGKDFKVMPIFVITWVLLMYVINTATAGALCEASEMVFVSVLLGAAFAAVPIGFTISVLIDKLVARQNVGECGQTLYRIDSCVGSLVEKRQAVKEKSANKAISDASVNSDAPVDEADSDTPVDEADSDMPIDE